MNYEEEGWLDASEDPDCPFIEHPEKTAQDSLLIQPWFALDQVQF